MKFAAVVATALLTACASVPRDAGVAEVEQALAARGVERVVWAAQPNASDDPQSLALLRDGELTAEKAVAIAMRNSPRLQVTLAELGIARVALLQESTIPNPLLEVEYRIPADPFHAYELRLAQSLVDLLRLGSRRAIARIGFDAASMRITAAVLRIAAEVRESYYDLLAASQQVAQNRVALESAKAAAELAVRQHDAGNITDLDLENEQASYEQAKLGLARAERDLLVAREALVRNMGLRDNSIEWQLPQDFPPLPASEPEPSQLEELAAAQRLDIAIVRREIDAAGRQLPLARLAALGELVGDIHYQRDAEGPRTWGPGLEFPLPLFNRGTAARNRVEAEWLRSKHMLNALLAESSSSLRAARASLIEARARVEYYRNVVVPRRERIVHLTTLEHNAMLVGTFQLLQSKQSEAEARRGLIEAQRDYWRARIGLDRALHGIGDR